jgi:hypothetical protein
MRRTAANGARLRDDAGLGLLEVVVAMGILLVLALGLLPLGVVAVSTTENEGHLVARTTEYAQDKMEQLLSLAYNDGITDTRTFPAATSGGTGLAVGGSSNASAPVAGYVDYLDSTGNLLTSTGTTPPSGWFYKRAWAISSPSSNMKQITVTATVAIGVGRAGRLPQATLVAMKTYPF